MVRNADPTGNVPWAEAYLVQAGAALQSARQKQQYAKQQLEQIADQIEAFETDTASGVRRSSRIQGIKRIMKIKRFEHIVEHAASGLRIPEALARRIDALLRGLPRDFTYRRLRARANRSRSTPENAPMFR